MKKNNQDYVRSWWNSTDSFSELLDLSETVEYADDNKVKAKYIIDIWTVILIEAVEKIEKESQNVVKLEIWLNRLLATETSGE